MAKVKQKVNEFISFAKKYWNEPPKNNYVSFKEIANLGIAGFGANWTTALASTIALDASNFLVGASIGIKPLDLYVMLIVANIIGIPIAFFRGWYFDNHNMKGGKFLPFLLRTSFPIVFLSTIFVWMPYEQCSYIAKIIIVEVFYIVIQFFLCFFNDSYAYIQQIVSPNAQERATVMSVSQIIFSMGPTITGFLIPTIAGLTFGMNNINTYRLIYPVFTVIGLIINNIFFRKVKERLILPKNKVEYVRISDAIREVVKNKYFWIINGAIWIGFLESVAGVILNWSFVYSHNGDKAAQLGIATTIIGNAALWSMLLAPLAIKKFGKRNLLIICNMLNVVLFAILYFSYNSLIAICVIMFLNGFVNTFGNIYLPNINADMRDCHQWKTGVRIDGLFGPLGLIGTFLGFFTGMVVPSIYESMGLHENYDVLYNDTLRNNLFKVLIICSIIGAVLNLIPYLFYDLTETKHKGYVNVLKIRAMFEDYGNNDLDDNEIAETMKIIIDAKKYYNKDKLKIDNSELKAAKKMPKKSAEEKEARLAAIRAARSKIKEIREINEKIDYAPIIIEELSKFSTLRYKEQLAQAKKVFENGKNYNYESAKEELQLAKSLPKKTKSEKEIRSDAINLARSKNTSAKLMKKYKNKVYKPTDELKNEIQNRKVKTLAETIRQRNDMKKYVKNASVYSRITAPYENAKNLIFQAENYTHLDEIEKLYEKTVAQQVNS